MASQFVMCAINYKAERGRRQLPSQNEAMKCAVTSNNELAAPTDPLPASVVSIARPAKSSHKSQAPWQGECVRVYI